MQLLIDIWGSFRRLPTWVQFWIVGILMPVNFATVLFLDAPGGVWLAVLAISGMALNLPFVFKDRGFGKGMALPHVVLWTPAVLLAVWLLSTLDQAAAGYIRFLVLFVVIDVISLTFDYKDARDWMRGDRSVA